METEVPFEDLFVQVTFYEDKATAIVTGHDIRAEDKNVKLQKKDLKPGFQVVVYWQGQHAWLKAVVRSVSGKIAHCFVSPLVQTSSSLSQNRRGSHRSKP